MKTVTEKHSGIRLAVNYKKVAVLKDGEPLMADKARGRVRTFKSHASARQFVSNLIWVSNGLMPGNFEYIPVAE